MAFLEFNGYKDEGITLNTEPVYAKNIAQLLRDHDINCVILNACMSAVADADPSANLSSVFLRNGISAVLAMSYNMHDSISKRFYSKFYSEFFVHQAPISIAASKARKALFDDRTRWNYVKKEEVLMQDWFVPVVYTSSEEPYRCSNHRPFFSRTLFTIHGLELFLPPIMSAAIYLLMFGKLCSLVKAEVGNWSNPSKSISTWQTWVIIVAPLFWPFGRKIGRLGRYWRIRQRLRVLAEDRQNVLRIEVALRRKRMVLLHSQEDVEEYASPFVDCLATIWERTHFVAFGGAVDAERFVQPKDLSFRDDWRLWVKAFTNIVYLWAYSLRRQHSSSTEEVESVVIIENLDALYPDEEEELKEKQYCVFAQSRLEGWIKEHFTTRTQQVSPYLMLTALRGRKFGHSVSEWLENGPGRCGVLDPTAMTGFVKTSQRYVDPTNASYDKDKWYDWSVSWFCGDVSRPPKKGLISALWNFWSILIEIFVCVLYKASTLEM